MSDPNDQDPPVLSGLVGDRFDTGYLGAPPGNANRGVQAFAVASDTGMVPEFVEVVPGEPPFVTHGFGRGQKDAIAFPAVVESL